MSEPIDMSSKVPPELQRTYREEFQRGVKLFKDSLAEYEKTTDVNKKAKFKEVMDKSLDAMNKAARGFLKGQNKEFAAQLKTDYQNFLHNDTPATYQKLNQDIDQLNQISRSA